MGNCIEALMNQNDASTHYESISSDPANPTSSTPSSATDSAPETGAAGLEQTDANISASNASSNGPYDMEPDFKAHLNHH